MRKYRRKCDIFFGMEHRLRQEELGEQFNRETKEAWRFAADAARITDERASSEDRKHTSGGVSRRELLNSCRNRRRSIGINPRQRG